MDLSFPGYQSDANSGSSPVLYVGVRGPMSAAESLAQCENLPDDNLATPARFARAAMAARTGFAPRKRKIKLSVCAPKRASISARRRSSHGKCHRRTVRGVKFPRIRHATATLERAGRVYAIERDRRGGIHLTKRRKITPGKYRLYIREKPKRFIVRDAKHRKLHRAKQLMITIVPITVR